MTLRRAARAARAAALLRAFALAAAMLGASCAGNLRWPYIRTQRYPAPMPSLVEPLPPGTESLHPPGPEEVLVVRHADPVKLRPAGQLSAFPMTFYEKSRRVHTGSWVYGSPGGRAEVIWPNGSTLLVFGRCAAVIGSQSRGEPAVIFYEIERVDLNLVERDQVRLVGGSLLTAESGPFVIQREHGDVLRVKNQSKKAGDLAFREAQYVLEPGQQIDLPLLDAGGEPLATPLGVRTVQGPGFELGLVGEVEVVEADATLRLRATGEHQIAGLGVRMQLLPGEEVSFLDLRAPPFVAPASSPSVPPPSDADALPVEGADLTPTTSSAIEEQPAPDAGAAAPLETPTDPPPPIEPESDAETPSEMPPETPPENAPEGSDPSSTPAPAPAPPSGGEGGDAESTDRVGPRTPEPGGRR